MYKVPLAFPDVGEEERRLLIEAYDTRHLSTGKYVKQFEEVLASYLGVKYVIAVSSGTAAILLAWNALKNLRLIKNKVEIPALNFSSDVAMVKMLGIPWKFVDWRDPSNFPVHLMGFPYPSPRNVLVEDCCEGLGAMLNGKKLGNLGLVSTHSFFTSHIITTGEGGACATDNLEIAEEIKSLRAYGRDFTAKPFKPYFFKTLGWNCKMSDVQAAIGIGQMQKLDSFLAKRRSTGKKLQSVNWNKHRPLFEYNLEAAYFGFPIIANSKDSHMASDLEKLSIETRPLLAYMPSQPWIRSSSKYKHALNINSKAFYIGCHHSYTEEQIEYLLQSLDSVNKNA